ncbi:hypothetical protein Ddye_026301 [Dipteronia dyeriana]|uniref:Uncharacterized protein n=1 Tax=Dipteronia dyeriana TaxID=168575 RepID=A0AAD9WPF5_9ROSI|nr:hypothetical protein Ddye_026301 [Dipteronia dyeriana]
MKRKERRSMLKSLVLAGSFVMNWRWMWEPVKFGSCTSHLNWQSSLNNSSLISFTRLRIRLEIIEKLENESLSIIKTTIEYPLNEDMASNASIITIQPLALIAQSTKTYLINLKQDPQ